MGLLDNIGGLLGTSMEDPRTMATLQMAQGLLGGGGGMQRLAGGLQGYGGVMAQARQQEEEKRRRMLQEQMLMQQLEAAKAQQAERAAAQAKEKAIDAAYQGAFRSGDQRAMAAYGGPTKRAAEAGANLPGQIDQQALIRNLMQADPRMAAQMAMPKPRKLTNVAAGGTLFDEEAGKAVFTAPKEDTPTSDFKNFQAVQQNPAFGTFLRDGQRASAQNISVNTGQKGLDNTLKLRGDFRSEPIYKAHQDVQSAHSQITAALKQASPAGDLAGATKLMKILDPGSVVRESELGMAMAASGLVDRMQNYASLVMSGQKLTPTQRVDFMKLADSLRVESEKQYNAKRGEYQGIATRNGLNVDDVLGPASSAPGGGWSITKVQ